jgi:hypothetical protein
VTPGLQTAVSSHSQCFSREELLPRPVSQVAFFQYPGSSVNLKFIVNGVRPWKSPCGT